MKGNFVAKHMNKVNRPSVHMSSKDKSEDIYNEYLIQDGVKEYMDSLKDKKESNKVDVENV